MPDAMAVVGLGAAGMGVVVLAVLGAGQLLRGWPAAAAAVRRVAGTLISALVTGLAVGTVVALHVHRQPGGGFGVRSDWYGVAVLGLLALRLTLAAPAPPPPYLAADGLARSRRLTMALTVACHNEDPVAFGRCLDSILAQTRLPEVLTVVDDGSDSADCIWVARTRMAAAETAGLTYHVLEFPVNRGKRMALAAGFSMHRYADVYVCVDSDTLLHPEAVERVMARFAGRSVTAVTGCVLAANRGTNLLTRLIDLRYASAFLVERAAYSALGSVLCCCGSLAAYRGDVVRKYLPDFLTQRFLGALCTYGDDRRLTSYCLREGRVLLAADAVAWTLVPERLGHFLRQQVRWSKSFFRESVSMLAVFGPARVCWWLTLVELGTSLGFTGALLYAVAVRPALSGGAPALTWLACVALLAYARSGPYVLARHPGLSWAGRAATMAVAPLFGFLSMVVLPLRLFALVTLKDARWGTRSRGAEVTFGPEPGRAVASRPRQRAQGAARPAPRVSSPV